MATVWEPSDSQHVTCAKMLLIAKVDKWSVVWKLEGRPLRGTNVKLQMLSFQIFTGLGAITPLQINGTIGNERGSEGHGNHGFLVPQIPTSSYLPAISRYLTHTHQRVLLSIRPQGCGLCMTQGVAIRADYRFTVNNTIESYHDSKLNLNDFLVKFLIDRRLSLNNNFIV